MSQTLLNEVKRLGDLVPAVVVVQDFLTPRLVKGFSGVMMTLYVSERLQTLKLRVYFECRHYRIEHNALLYVSSMLTNSVGFNPQSSDVAPD